MAIISLCGNVGANTGPIACDTSRGVPKVLILGGAEFTPDQYASSEAFKEALLEAVNLPNGDAGKMYPFPEIQNVVNNTEANTTGTTGLGLQLILREGRPAYTFGVLIGTNLEKQLRKFNRRVVPVMVFDDAGNTWGSLTSTKNFKGTNALIYVSGKPFSDGSSVDTLYTNVSISFTSAADFFDYAAFVNTDFNVNELEGLLDATLYEAVENTANAYKIGVVYENAQLGGNINLYDKYGADLAVAALWKAYSGTALATPLTITSVAVDAALKAYTVTLDSTAYSALGSLAKIKLQLDTPAALQAGDVTGIESVPLILTKD
jgi:hypothetical protein